MIGVYCITNTVNGKRYVGQSWNIEKRWVSEKTNMHNKHLRSSFEKYGLDTFTFEVLVEIKDSPFAQKWLDKMESKFIEAWDTMNPARGYNKKGGGSRGKHTAETRRRISEAGRGKRLSEEAKQKVSEARKGKRLSEEAKQKVSEARRGVPRSEETRRRISEARKGRKLSEETKQRIAEARRGVPRSEETGRRISEANKGRKLSEEVMRRRMEGNRLRKLFATMIPVEGC